MDHRFDQNINPYISLMVIPSPSYERLQDDLQDLHDDTTKLIERPLKSKIYRTMTETEYRFDISLLRVIVRAGIHICIASIAYLKAHQLNWKSYAKLDMSQIRHETVLKNYKISFVLVSKYESLQNLLEEILQILYKEKVVRDLGQEENKEAEENLRKPAPEVFVQDRLDLSAKLGTLVDLEKSLLDIYTKGKSMYDGEAGLKDPKTAKLSKGETKGPKNNQRKQGEKKIIANNNLVQNFNEEKQKVKRLQDQLEEVQQKYRQLDSQLEEQKRNCQQAEYSASALKERNDELENKIKTETEEHGKTRADLAGKEGEHKRQLAAKEGELKGQLAAKEGELKSQLAAKEDELKRQLYEKDVRIYRLEHVIHAYDKEIGSKDLEIDALQQHGARTNEGAGGRPSFGRDGGGFGSGASPSSSFS